MTTAAQLPGHSRCLFFVSLVVSLLTTLTCGCTKENNLATVHGRVSVNGEPIAGAQLLFMPPGDRVATGTTDEDGYYQLSTIDKHDGAVVGQHLVAIVCRPTIPVAPMNGAMSALPNVPAMETPELEDWVSPIPEKYGNLADPALSVSVNPGDNEIDFDLE